MRAGWAGDSASWTGPDRRGLTSIVSSASDASVTQSVGADVAAAVAATEQENSVQPSSPRTGLACDITLQDTEPVPPGRGLPGLTRKPDPGLRACIRGPMVAAPSDTRPQAFPVRTAAWNIRIAGKGWREDTFCSTAIFADSTSRPQHLATVVIETRVYHTQCTLVCCSRGPQAHATSAALSNS